MKTILRNRLYSGGLFILLFLTASIGWGQGLEDFSNLTVGSSYSDGSFVGNNGITWSYIQSRDDNNTAGVTAPALMLRRSSDNSKVTSSAISGGIGDFSVKLYKGFTGGGDRQVELLVNGVSQGLSTPFDDYSEHTFSVTGINISGNITIEIKNSTSKQVIVDDITWTGFGGTGNTAPFITNITQTPDVNNVTSTDPVSVSADIVDSDGISSAELHWGTASGSLTNTIPMSVASGNTYTTNSSIPAQLDGTTIFYEIKATDNNLVSLSTTTPEQSYTVSDPIPFTLPYANGLRTPLEYNEAVGYGFLFNNATLNTTGGGYIKIDPSGSIVTAPIDFSIHTRLLVNFDMQTWGGNTAQELTVFVSNDNGVTYNPLQVYAVPPGYITFELFVDLSTLNGTQGRIKFEMTGGTNSIRFRDLTLQEYDGYFYTNNTWTPFDPSGTSTLTSDMYINDGTATFTTDMLAHTITVNTGATLKVEKVLTIGGNLVNHGDFIFVSTATGNGELAKVETTSDITGDFTVQRYMSHNRAYRVVSSPVTTSTSIHHNWQEGATCNTCNPNPGFGTHITGTLIDQTDGFDATITGNPSMFTADVGNQTFVEIDNTDVNTLNAGEPYLLFVRGDRNINLTNDFDANETTLRATGSLFYGTQIQNFPATNAAGEFVMFGNPYQSAVDVKEVFSNAGSTNINPSFYYVYDPTLGTHGAYVTVDLTLAGNGTNTSGSDANKFLQPGQGAQVATAAAGVSSLEFTEDDKAPGMFTTTNRNGNTATNDMIVGQLYTADNFNNGGPVHDSFGILFSDNNDNALTALDAVKPMNFYENLGLDHNGTLISLESREMPQIGEVFPLFTGGYNHTDYVLSLKVDGLDNSIFYLDDLFTGSSTLIDNGELAYNFTVDANNPMSIAADRFSIRTEERLGVNENNLLAGVRLYPNPLADNTFYINAPRLNGEQLLVTITDMTGRNIFTQNLECQSNTVTVPMGSDISSGIYLVTLNHGGESHTYRLIKE